MIIQNLLYCSLLMWFFYCMDFWIWSYNGISSMIYHQYGFFHVSSNHLMMRICSYIDNSSRFITSVGTFVCKVRVFFPVEACLCVFYFCSVWWHFLSCLLLLFESVNFVLHLVQLNGFSPVWILSCVFKVLALEHL